MKNLISLFSNLVILIVCGLLYTSCTPVIYGPTTQALPGLEKKGDIKLSGASALASYDITGVDFGVAYSPKDKIGVMLSYSNFSEPKPSIHSEYIKYGGHYKLVDVGLGTYRQLIPNLIWENYALVSAGEIDIANRVGNQLNANLLKFGAQSGILYKRKILEIGVSTKLSYLNYSSIEGDLDQPIRLRENNRHLMLEPGLVFALGYDPIKVYFQLVQSNQLNKSHFDRTQGYMSLGLSVSFNQDQVK